MIATLFALALAQIPAGTAQLVATPDRPQAAINGDAITFNLPPRMIGGRTMVPLIETANLLGLTVTVVDKTVTAGRVVVMTDFTSATQDGQPLAISGNFEKRDGALYISARLLADAFGARFRPGMNGEFLITATKSRDDDPSLPQPRFRTDKDVYAIGEPVNFFDYSFDPVGIISRFSYTNRKPAYFNSGDVTVSLQVWNDQGKTNTTRRTIRISNEVRNTPLQFALKYGDVGDTLPDDSRALRTLTRYNEVSDGPPMLFSDSPEQIRDDGQLARDTFTGPFRVLAYHLNQRAVAGKLFVLVRNTDTKPATVKVNMAGETAPAKIEGVLGQVTLMDYLSSRPGPTLQLEPGETSILYTSPLIVPQSGLSIMLDGESDVSVETSVVFSSDSANSIPTLAALPALPMDTNHVRGTFAQATRRFDLDLGLALPAKAVIGDPTQDPPATGKDFLTGTDVSLKGNYGVGYEITLRNATGTALAIVPRGGLYKGVVRIEEQGYSPLLVPLPKSGNLADPNKPMLFHRARTDTVKLLFVPASGSHLPVHLLFYRP